LKVQVQICYSAGWAAGEGVKVSPSNTQVPTGTGQLLAHADPEDVDADLLVALNGSPGSGLVLRNAPAQLLRFVRPRLTGLLADDAGFWAREVATAAEPLGAGIGQPGLFAMSLDAYAAPRALAGAHVIYTPSRFVLAGDFAALDAVVAAGARSNRTDVTTLVATDPAMLDAPLLPLFTSQLVSAARPLALLFATGGRPLEKRGRAAALRQLLTVLPNATVLATEPLVAADVLSHGGAASIGLRSGLREPSRPIDRAGGGYSEAFLPGLFLRELWEHRSPGVYADWYVTAQSPWCGPCGRHLDVFSTAGSDKRQILLHNVHEWLTVAEDLGRRQGHGRQRAFLHQEHLSALGRHVTLHRVNAAVRADRLLRVLAELDDPAGRKTAVSGAWL
jgi:hypothetical protein